MQMKFIKHTLALAISLSIMLTYVPGSVFAEVSGGTVKYTSAVEHAADDDPGVRVFRVSEGGSDYEGTCAEIGVEAAKSGTAKPDRIKNNSRHAKLIYQYAVVEDWWTGPESAETIKKELGLDFTVRTTKKALVQYMNQISVQGVAGWKAAAVARGGFTPSFADTIADYVSGIDVSKVSVPSGFELYLCDSGNHQNFAVWRYEPYGHVYLQKKAADTDTDYIREAAANYSLEGAKYQLYSDPSMKDPAKDANGKEAVLTTGAGGKTNLLCMPAGTYYVKETAASKGFLPDPALNSGKGNKVTVDSGNTEDAPALIRSADPPSCGELIKLRKTDKTGRNGWKKLIGAEYTLRYYAVDPGRDDVSGLVPARSWTFRTVKKTDEAGEVYAGIDCSADEAVPGSDGFYTEGGRRVLPCGVFTVEETRAPSGLKRNTEVYYGKVYQPANGAAAKTVFNTKKSEDLRLELSDDTKSVNDEVPQAVKIVLQKINAANGKNEAMETGSCHSTSRKTLFTTLAGAVYEVYYDDTDLEEPELVGRIVTDENGRGELSERTMGDERFIGDRLPLGHYIVKEVSPPVGFALDRYSVADGKKILTPDQKITIRCTYKDGEETVNKDTEAAFENGEYHFRARAEITDTYEFTYTIESREAPVRTYIRKTDAATGKEVPGAELQIISDNEEDRGTVVEQWISEDTEHIVWELPDGNYILREITAPKGYEKAEEIGFEVRADKVVCRVEMKDRPVEKEEKISSPKTGDDNDPVIFAAAALLSAAALTIMLIKRNAEK